MDNALQSVLAGSNDERALAAVYFSMRSPCNDAQRTFHRVWEASELLGGDGFEMLVEQRTSLEEYAAVFGQIGLPAVRTTFERVIRLIPATLRAPGNEDALFEHVSRLFDELKGLLDEYYHSATNLVVVAAEFIRNHADAFRNES